MRITLDISDPGLAEWLQSIPEGRLAAIREEIDADEELAAAIQHSIDREGYESLMTAEEYLAEKSRAAKS